MKEAFEKIKERLEEVKECDVCKGIRCVDCDNRYKYKDCDTKQQHLVADRCKDIVSEVEAEYGNGWIPVERALPDEKGAVLVTYTNVNDDVRVEVTMYEPKRKSFWVSPYVIAWMPLPLPYQTQKGE